MNDDSKRPSPDALLAEAGREGRGRLKIFLGAAPGVGKTYAMLSAARQRLAEGQDVVAGVVETHGRAETQQLTRDLPFVASRRAGYRGRQFDELDLDAVLARRPQLVLVDELAHTNIPGSRHDKRWQDVEELLEAGIDVYSTLNVQHLESLNDIIERISRVKVRETVPDAVLERADEIELIDLPPEELIQRLHQGKVYVPEQAQRAIQHFFSRGNLMALRELAMRAAAERVGADILSYMRARAIEGPWPTRERLLVCVSEEPVSERLVRLAKRMADQRQVPWIAVHVSSVRDALGEAARERVHETLALAEELGAETVTLSGYDVAAEILAYAGSRNVSQIIVGRGRPRAWLRPRLRRSLPDRLLGASGDFVVTVANRQVGEQAPRPAQAARERQFVPQRYLEAGLVTGLATSLAFGMSFFLENPHLTMAFLAGVLVVALRQGLSAALFASVLSFLVFNFLFTEPRFTLNVYQREDVVTLVFFLLVAVISGNLAARVRAQMDAIRVGAHLNALLFDFSRRIAGAIGRDDLAWSVCEYVGETLNCQALVLVADAHGQLHQVAGEAGREGLVEIDRAAAQWALEHNEPAGRGTGTLPACRWYFIPLRAAERPGGVLGVTREERRWNLSVEQRRLLFAMRDQASLALERMRLAEEMEKTQLVSETEKLRSALLSSVSHDLRTPLVSIMGSTGTLLEMQKTLPEDQQRELLTTVMEEAERLNRYVQNLLDMTRLGYGAIVPKREWSDLRDSVADATRRLQRELAAHPVQVDIAQDFPWMFLDPVLTEQVLVNLLDNAAKYSPPAAPIVVRARMAGDRPLVQVIDQGVGIPEAERETVFNMFHRVKAGDSRTAGAGLGLAICRGFVEAMGGSIHVRSAGPSGGTIIEFTLPPRQQPNLPEEEAP